MGTQNMIDELRPYQIAEEMDVVANNKATKAFISARYLTITTGILISLAVITSCISFTSYSYSLFDKASNRITTTHP